MTPWQGGTQVTAFVTGGFVPPELRGTSNSALMHVAGTSFDLTYPVHSWLCLTACVDRADWYPTLCTLVGVSPTNTVVLPGADPTPRPIDGVDVWCVLSP